MTAAWRTERGAWLALVGASALAITVFVVWIARTPLYGLREQLKSLQFWSLEVCLLAVIACGWIIRREVSAHLGKSDWLRILALAAVAVILTVFVAPRTNRIFYDEQIYQGIGHNMADLRLAQMCLDGTVEYGRLQCTAGEYNKQPYAYPHLLSVLYRIGGAGPGWAFGLNAAAMALTVALVYFVVLVLFRDEVGALFAGLIVALTPHQILWSATAAVEPLASLACIAAIAAVAHFAHTRTTAALLATGVTTAYAVQFRAESFLIVVVVGLLMFHLAPEEFKRRRLWWVVLLCFALVAVHVAHMLAVRNEGWGTTAARFSMQYVPANLSVNGRFYLADERFPVIYTVLALAGLTGAGLVVPRLAMLMYFAVFFAIGLLFYAGSYNYGADVRYSVMTYPPVAVLAGVGAGRVARWVERWRPPHPATAVVAAGLAFQFLWYAPLVRATSEEAWAARADAEFAQSVAPELPRNSLVLTHNPGMFHLSGVNASQMFLVADNPARLEFLLGRYAGGVYLHWNFWCNVADPVQQDLCRKVKDMASTEVFKESRQHDQRFSLLRVTSVKPR